jgi:membrane protein
MVATGPGPREGRRPLGGDLRTLAGKAVGGFAGDRAGQMAAAIAYYVLFSIFPLAIVVVACAGLFVDETTVREDVIDQVVGRIGLEGENASDIAELLQSSLSGFGALGLAGLVGLVWTASGVMTAVRSSVNTAFGVEDRRPFFRGKLLDIGFVFCVAPLLAASLAITFLVQLAGGAARTVEGRLGAGERITEIVIQTVSVLGTIAFSTLVIALVYRWVPARRPRLADVWVGALAAAILLELAKNALALYFRWFGNYDAVYGSLGAVISFMVFVYVAAAILLLGAEAAAEWPRVRAGSYDRAPGDEDGPSIGRRIVKELVKTVATPSDGAPAEERPEGRTEAPG